MKVTEAAKPFCAETAIWLVPPPPCTTLSAGGVAESVKSGAVATAPGASINQTGTVNSATAPPAKASVVAIYLTGAGLTNAADIINAPVTVNVQ